ncbi:MAG: T9SS type A sorting domain-containing protein [Bacteroidetes bacterium]|nr:T9SS type A sorting domain-containing protein [Bacteroidota bacterium]
MKQFVFIIFYSFVGYSAVCQGAWTWMGGSKYANDSGQYFGSYLWPSARGQGCHATDSYGNLWVYSVDHNSSDLWMWNGLKWTLKWMPNKYQETGIYPKGRGIADSTKVPSGRIGCACYIDSNSNFYLFGGRSKELKNDFWKFDGMQWFWLEGDSTSASRSIKNNIPGDRYFPVYWQKDNNFFFFGGYTYNRILADLWMYNGKKWVYTGSDTVENNKPRYGLQEVPDQKNSPGSRMASAQTMLNNSLLIYGGATTFHLTSLFDKRSHFWTMNNSNQWIWKGGDRDTYSARCFYKQSHCDVGPGSRSANSIWATPTQKMFLYGGSLYGGHPIASSSLTSDLWVYENGNWHFVGQSNSHHGEVGKSDSSNWPGYRSSAINWIDDDGNLWLFGGYGYDADSNLGYLNDLWKFTPDTNFTISKKEPVEQQLNVYPNPVQNQINIQLQESAKSQHIRIFNTQGKIVWQQKPENDLVQVSTNNWPKGLYILQMHSALGVVEKKIVVK